MSSLAASKASKPREITVHLEFATPMLHDVMARKLTQTPHVTKSRKVTLRDLVNAKPTPAFIGKALPANFVAPGAKAKTAKPRPLSANAIQNQRQAEWDRAHSFEGRRLVSKREMKRAQRDADMYAANAGTI